MKRLILILICLAIFYAGAVWALEGCTDFDVGPNTQHHNERGVPAHHHDSNAAPHHSHSDQSRVHCPNLLGEFLISSVAFVKSSNDHVYLTPQPGEPISGFLLGVTSRGHSGGPPGSVHLKVFPRHLLLSVIRI
jgi:hypothetical protein